MIWKLFMLWAVQAQVLDPREVRYFTPDDLHLIVSRCRDLQGAPRLEDDHFPCTAWVQAREDFHWQTEMYCAAGAEVRLHHAGEYQEMQKLAARNRIICEAVLDARKGFYYVTIRRRALATARELMGSEAFAKGEIP